MSARKEYAKELLRDSFSLWERGERVAVFAGVVLGSLLLGVLLAFGIGIAFTREAGLWVSGGLAAWMFILVFVISPYRLWRQKSALVNELRGRIQPKLVITGPYLTIVKDDNNPETRIYSIGVKNDSDAEPVRGCEPFLSVTNLNGATVVRQKKLRFRDLSVTGEKFDLSPKKEEQIRLVTSGGEFFHLNLDDGGHGTPLKNTEEYCLRLIVYNENGAPAEKSMKLSHFGKGMKIT